MSENINVNKNTGKFSFYTRKEVPWWDLGWVVKEAETATEALTMAQLDYIVNTGPVYCSFVPNGLTAKWNPATSKFHLFDSMNVYRGQLDKKGEIIPNLKCVYRDDTKQTFGLVSNDYEVVQNFESLDVIYNIIKGSSVTHRDQIKIETAGALGNGETIFVTAKMPSYMIKIGSKEDVIDKYIVFTTSHNKSAMITALITDVRVVCANTLRLALKATNKISVKHTRNVRQKFEEFGNILGVANKYSAEAKVVLEHLASVNVTTEQVSNYVFDLMLPKDKRELVKNIVDINKISNELISSKIKTKVNEVFSYIDYGPGQEIARGTAYHLYNGMTSYLHNGIKYKSSEDKFNSIMDGVNGEKSSQAFKRILEYA